MEIIQTVITLIFIYLVLSLLASGIQEIIAMQQELRAKQLKKSILLILNESNLLNNIEEYNIGDPVLFDDNQQIFAKRDENNSNSDNNQKVIIYFDDKKPLDIGKDKYGFYFKDQPNVNYIKLKNKNYYNNNSKNSSPLLANIVYYINSEDQLKVDEANERKNLLLKSTTLNNFKKVELLTDKIYNSSCLRSANQKDIQVLSLVFPHFFSNLFSIIIVIIGFVSLLFNRFISIFKKENKPDVKPQIRIKSNLRKSEGFSYIDPPELFGKAVMEEIQNELPEERKITATDNLDSIAKKLSYLKFYTPGLCEIKELIKKIKNNRLFDSTNSENSE